MTEIYRPEEVDQKSSGSQSFIGVQPVKIIGFLNEPNKFGDDDDVNIAIELGVEGSDYTRSIYISGPTKLDADGRVEFHPFMKKLYHLFDLIGFKGGIDIKGNFVDEGGAPISDIGAYLSAKFASSSDDAVYPYLAFIYKRANKAGHKYEFSYTVYPKLYSNTADGRKDLSSFVTFLRDRKVIKEFTGETTHNAVIQEAFSGQAPSALNL